jgi:hypothetical protein
MRIISAYSLISFMIGAAGIVQPAIAQDTITFPLKIKVGLEVSGPALYYSDKKILSTEAYISADLNEKVALVAGGGSLRYSYSQYNYEYQNKGIFARLGADFNLLKPDKSLGKYWAGVGLHYGINRFNTEVPAFRDSNYWGLTTSSVPQKTAWGHFLEVTPGVRAEVFRNITIGWTLSLRMMLYTGTGNNLRPLYSPGFGNGAKRVTSGVSYFIVWNIPYKKKQVIIKKEEPDESEDNGQPGTEQTGSGQQPIGTRQQSPGSMQP